jgi:signal transduction histidine kinase
LLNSSRETKFAVRRVDRTIARSIASSAIFIVFLQALPKAIEQTTILHPFWLWLGVLVVGGIQVAQLVWAWLGKSIVPLYTAMYVAMLVLAITWPIQLIGLLAPGDMPWIWWLLAIAGLNAFGAFQPVYAVIAGTTLSLTWLALSQTDAFGPRDFFVALQDTALSYFFSTLLGMLLIGLRQQTAKIDLQLDRKAQLAAETASARALETERSRMNALVHDSVLTALLLGAGARSGEELATASRAASNAIARLTDDHQEQAAVEVASSQFFEALADVAKHEAPDLLVVTEVQQSLAIPAHVAQALTEATLQAISNSVRHAGTVRLRELRLSSTDARIKVVVKDDGRGFRESRVPKSRLGLRLSIRTRMADVGGRVAIQSQPGQGCTIALTWSPSVDCDEVSAP